MATGVAKPKAHGQAITTTVIAKLNDSSKLLLNIIFRMKVRREIPRIKGTNIALTLSASREIGALDLLIKTLMDEFTKSKKYFDFGISTENGGQVLNQGLISQKEGFGGRSVAHQFFVLAAEG